MPMNRVQFQRGLSMVEFLERYGTEDKCRAALQAARWPRGFVCPVCGGAARSHFVRGGLRYWQCGACPHQTSWISGTVFDGQQAATEPVVPDPVEEQRLGAGAVAPARHHLSRGGIGDSPGTGTTASHANIQCVTVTVRSTRVSVPLTSAARTLSV